MTLSMNTKPNLKAPNPVGEQSQAKPPLKDLNLNNASTVPEDDEQCQRKT
ncbi:hypothetical protein COLO4_13641 [Corchorus olitorius]|uniref:Uncharacterized protein n=1 Tax=Corchorus olitorius TaxID=93759 RepID=A0A1R3JVI3_9ROSI|nr:hypothetical protein COLO4_13641 [Corchorus olitorius]